MIWRTWHYLNLLISPSFSKQMVRLTATDPTPFKEIVRWSVQWTYISIYCDLFPNFQSYIQSDTKKYQMHKLCSEDQYPRILATKLSPENYSQQTSQALKSAHWRKQIDFKTEKITPWTLVLSFQTKVRYIYLSIWYMIITNRPNTKFNKLFTTCPFIYSNIYQFQK